MKMQHFRLEYANGDDTAAARRGNEKNEFSFRDDRRVRESINVNL